jgi:hypothetical protein
LQWAKATTGTFEQGGEKMSSIAISAIVFVCVFGGAVLGMYVRTVLPEHHLSDTSKDVLKLQMALVSTMTALVLGLLVTSAKSSYDAQSTALTQMSAKIVLLDRVLAHYGPDTKETRDLLRDTVTRVVNRMSTKSNQGLSELGPPTQGNEVLFDRIQDLSPKDDSQRALKAQALSIAFSVGETRWLQFAQASTSISLPLLVMLVLWLTTLFVSFGLLAPRNGTVVASLFVAALSVSGAILLILELYVPYGGLIQVSTVPLRAALTQLGK